ncbi:YbhB/YbcL family Raf kinase inhibitor-like protein [Salinimicrobium flavum]|uniref:YbhB/YbcL family Raf kinase inhibitor-like protein n=1 Tax=Salinimicrobium flavum TaxID=1737065 RepID=A0ABW5J0T5_9FLAO
MAVSRLTVESPAFDHEQMIPQKYTCDGEDINPPLKITGIPPEAESLVIIVEDPDAPNGIWDHWLVWNIPPSETIAENTLPGDEGINSFGRHDYGGPCPPSGTHRYFFKVYALKTSLNLKEGAKKQVLENAMKKNIIAEGELIGLYSKNQRS